MTTALQQGHADGLCGLYAALNFLRQTDAWQGSEPASDFAYILETCQEFGWLTPGYLTEGFQDYQIKMILERQFANYRMPYAAYFAQDVQAAKNYKRFDDLVQAVAVKGGWIIANADKRNHWLLLSPSDNGMVVADSANPAQPVSQYNSKQRSFGAIGSIVILPQPRPIIEVDL